MDQVLGGLECEVAADRAHVRLVRARGAVDRADDRDRVGPIEGERDEGPRRDELDKTAEERLLAMDGVVLLGERAVDVDELEPDDPEASFLVAREDPPDQETLDAVGFDENQCPFGHAGAPQWSDRASGWRWAGRGGAVRLVGGKGGWRRKCDGHPPTSSSNDGAELDSSTSDPGAGSSATSTLPYSTTIGSGSTRISRSCAHHGGADQIDGESDRAPAAPSSASSSGGRVAAMASRATATSSGRARRTSSSRPVARSNSPSATAA